MFGLIFTWSGLINYRYLVAWYGRTLYNALSYLYSLFVLNKYRY